MTQSLAVLTLILIEDLKRRPLIVGNYSDFAEVITKNNFSRVTRGIYMPIVEIFFAVLSFLSYFHCSISVT